MEIYCAKHIVQKKIYSLFPPIYLETEQICKVMKVVDQVISEGMRHAENKCRKIGAREVPFSVKLAKVGCCIKVWKLVMKHLYH